MPRSAITGIFTRVSNSFSNPVFGTLIDPTDATAYFDDLDVGLNPAELDGPVRIIDALQVGTTGTAAGTVEFFNATSGSITIAPPTGALGSVTMTLPAATDTFVGKNTTDVLTNKTLTSPVINGGTASALTGFSLRDTSAAFNLTFTATSSPALGANRAITFDVKNANRIVTLGDNISFAGAFTQAGAFTTTFTSTGATNLTLPTAGTLMTLDQTEIVTGIKTFGSAGAVGRFKLAGTTSGAITLDATAVAGSNTLTLPAETATLITGATTATFTNKTFNSTGTGNTLQVSGVTISAGQYPGEPTTGNATAGNVGEYIESIIASGSATSITTTTAKDITTITLTAGDWDVTGIIYYLPAATTSVTTLAASLNPTAANTFDSTAGRFNQFQSAANVMAGGTFGVPLMPYRFSVSGSTTIHLVAQAIFTASTLTAYGIVRARRIR